MIDRAVLLSDLQKLLTRLEVDLLERSESADVPDVGQALHAEFDRAKSAERTAQNFEDWRSDAITQAAAAWVLSCVFVRFLEDNRLIDPPKIAGPGERLQRARDEHELYFREHLKQTDRDYLLSVFDQLAKLPGTKDVFGEHNPIRELPNWLSGDAAGELLRFFHKIDANTGILIHDFTDPNWDTRFLGDLYQDLSEAARKKYALLQTPEFVEEFILDRTLNPALDAFGLDAAPVFDKDGKPVTEAGFRMIDPACGSGHFLLGAFSRILDNWQRKEPGTNVRELVQRALNSIHGVDVNPYAVAIARFRLLLAAIKACGVTRLADAPGFRLNLACGDSLYHGRQRQMRLEAIETDESHYFHNEDSDELKRILREGAFHAVVANPPYITAKDSAANSCYRQLYKYCYGQFQLVVPFLERIFLLAARRPSAFIGAIVGNAFSRADFGRKIVENGFPNWDITHVVDTSGTYIPGHGNPDGTPTLMLFGRNQPPVADTVRMLISIRTERSRPDVLAQGKAWLEVLNGVCNVSKGEFIESSDVDRRKFHCQPWPITGDEEANLIDRLEEADGERLENVISEIGRSTHTGEDDAFCLRRNDAKRMLLQNMSVMLVEGKDIRNLLVSLNQWSLFPYDLETGKSRILFEGPEYHHYWPIRSVLQNRLDYGETPEERGLRWHEHSMFFSRRYRETKYLCFAFTATHNHFALVKRRAIFKQTAPIVVMKDDASDEFRTLLFAVLNSSITCFWMRQHGFPRGGFAEGKWQERFNFNNTCLESLPFPREALLRSEALASLSVSLLGASDAIEDTNSLDVTGRFFDESKKTLYSVIQNGTAIQEELDWECYRLYGLIEESLSLPSPPPLSLGQRAFEIVLARKMVAGEIQTTWFERHGSTPITELPTEWPDDYRKLVERRIALIESDPNIRLIEQPEYKRRWNTEPWDSQLERAVREWLLDRLESYFDFDGRMNDSGHPTAKLDIALVSVAKLADVARQDAEFQQLGELYRDDPAFDVQALVAELVAVEGIPLLPVLHYKPTGLRKHAEWEKTWELQREEDRLAAQLEPKVNQLKVWREEFKKLTEALKTAKGDAAEVLEQEKETLAGNIQNLTPIVEDLTEERDKFARSIPVPPKYDSKDFLGSNFWRLRGKLDVPKERWISFPHCEGPDGTAVIAWAGYDHLQQARAISAYYVDIQERLGGRDDPRLIPLLACIVELLPWLKQWHNAVDPEFGMAMGDYFEGFVNEEARQLGKTIPEIKAWETPKRVSKRQTGRGKNR